MLVPRFTIRAMLVVMTFCAVFFLVIGIAFRGQNWAWGIAIGVLSLAVTALVHAACFGMVWLFAQLFTPSPAASGRDGWLTAADLLTPVARTTLPPSADLPPPREHSGASNE
jgi:hypothetical protein